MSSPLGMSVTWNCNARFTPVNSSGETFVLLEGLVRGGHVVITEKLDAQECGPFSKLFC